MKGGEEKKYDVLCVGLALGNIVVHPFPEKFEGGDTMQVEEITVMCGGDAFNQATVLSALGHKTALISKVADDVTGNMVLDQMKARGVDTSLVALDKEIGTSSCIVMVYPGGQRRFCTFKGCLRNFGGKDINFEAAKQAKIVSIGGLYSMPSFDREASIELFRKAREGKTATVLDTKYDAFHIGLAGIKNLLEYTDYFFPSYEEASYLSGLEKPEDIVHFFVDRGALHVGVKLGGRGCYLLTQGFEGLIPSFKSPVLDTTGAGDNVMAGLIHGLLHDWKLTDSVLYANAAGARAVSRLGATDEGEYIETINHILMQTPEGEKLVKEAVKQQ